MVAAALGWRRVGIVMFSVASHRGLGGRGVGIVVFALPCPCWLLLLHAALLLNAHASRCLRPCCPCCLTLLDVACACVDRCLRYALLPRCKRTFKANDVHSPDCSITVRSAQRPFAALALPMPIIATHNARFSRSVNALDRCIRY